MREEFKKEGSSKPFTGSTESTYDDGNPYIQANIKDGQLHGEYKAYYPDSLKMGLSNYEDGVQQKWKSRQLGKLPRW